MEDIKIFSEKTLEMDFNMYSSIDDESMEMFYASGCVHPRFKLINKIESKLPITVKVRNRSVSSSLLLSGDLDIMVRDDDFINCLDEFISSKGLPLYVMREGRFPEIKNVIVKDNTIKKMTLKIQVVNNIALKDEAFLAFRPHSIKRKLMLLSKRLWVHAMGEVYNSLSSFLKVVVVPHFKDTLSI